MSTSGARYGRQQPRSGEEQSLIRYWLVLRERLWAIVACTVVVLLAAVVYVEVAPRSYQAQAEILVQAASPNDAVLTGLPVLRSSGDPTQDILTAASLVTTQPVAQAVVSSLHLRMSAVEALGDVSATPVGQAGLLAVQATAPSPALAQRLADGFVAQAIALGTARMHAAINQELPTLQGELAAVPLAQRYGPGSLGQQVIELRQLLHQSDPTLISAAPAILPAAPSSPKKKTSLIAGLIAGLLVGIGVAFLLHALDPRVRRQEQLRERLGLPVLARIPRQGPGRRQRKRSRPLLPAELSAGAQEGYRTLRTILAARRRESSSRVVLITGSAPSEGKSTTALGLVAALAAAGARVILIEADLRKPTIATSLKLGADFNGIEDVLTGRVGLSEALVSVRVDGSPIRVLAAHPSGGSIAGGLSFPLVRRLLEDARSLADFVVIDSAPLTEVIDALPFAQAADEAVIVARLDQTRLNKLDELDDLLVQHGVNRTGVVLIGEHPLRGEQHYYGYRDGRAAAPAPGLGGDPEPSGERLLRG